MSYVENISRGRTPCEVFHAPAVETQHHSLENVAERHPV